MQVKQSIVMAALIAALGSAVPALEAQDRHPHPVRQGSGWLLENSAALNLSEAQSARLQEIAQRLEERNRPLVARLRAAGVPMGPPPRRMSEEERRELHAKLQEHRPTLLQLRRNTHAAMQAAREVLTPEQLEMARELMREREGRERRDGNRGAPHRGSGR
jgi:hypothetical protein